MPVKLIFRCQFCTAAPDPLTQLSLEAQLQELTFGQYLDAHPGPWLAWQGRGLYGPARYACPDHRGDLTAFLRYHYGTIGWHPWKRPPYPSSVRTADTERAVALGGKAPGSKWSFGPKIA